MTSGGKQLTTPPENLKEAIDWVLRVSGRDSDKENEEGKKAIKGLAEELTASMRKKPYEENDDVKKILTEIMYDANISPTGPVIRLAYALQKFIRYERDRNKQQWMIGDKGIVQKDSSYNFTYGSSKWLDDVYNADNDGSKRRKGVQCFFTAIEKIYEGLTELFFNCKTEWSSQSLSGSGHSDTLNQFMTTNGFSGTQLNTSMTGDKIATQAFQGLNEFSEAYGAAGSNPSLDAFRSQLEQKATTDPSKSPLSALYILATYAYVKSSSPAAPSFAGYSGTAALAGGAYGFNLGGLGTFMSALLAYPFIRLSRPPFDSPSNLKEAIDWILRVTGKDGQDAGSDKSEELAKAITELPEFKQAIDAAAKKLTESGCDVSQALEDLRKSNTLGPIIGKVAEGLKSFIGYGSSGQGIADLVDPLQQLRKGVLEFLRMFLDNLRNYVTNTNDATKEIRMAFGGKGTFDEAIGSMSKLDDPKNQVKGVLMKLKNMSEIQNKSDVTELAKGCKTYFEGVITAMKSDPNIASTSSQISSLCSQLQKLLDKVAEQNSDLGTPINSVKSANQEVSSKISGLRQPAKSLVEGATRGTSELLRQLQKTGGYKSSYPSTFTWNGGTNNDKIAQIFLGCLPLYYYCLTYLYWKCRVGGEWSGQKFNRPTLQSYMAGHGYVADHFNKGKGASDIVKLLGSLDQFSTVSSSPTPSHPELLGALDNSLYSAFRTSHSSASNLNDHSLSALFYLCRTYFIGKQIIQPVSKQRPPTSIREMLYWLSGLQFSPYYYDLKKQIESHIPEEGLRVADSSKPSTSGPSGPGSASASTGDTLTRIDFNEYLTSTCVFAPAVLGTIQGHAADSEKEPWLHSLFSNTEFKLNYPTSGTALFYALSQYSYALQFQLSFLYRQCVNGSSDGFGWNQCTFGQHINTQNARSAANVSSWICSSSACEKANRCQHNSPSCNHFQQCGQQNTSPLQAFLTDNLKGFHVSLQPTPDSPNHLHNHPPGFMCHVPMGFADKLRRDNAGGANIVYALAPFFGTSNDPLRQLSEKLTCLTKRTPRTLGDLFGFIWHLNGQLFKTRPTMAELIGKFDEAFQLAGRLSTTFNNDRNSAITKLWDKITQLRLQPSSRIGATTPSGLSRSLEAMAPAIPFLYQIFMAEDPNTLPGTLFDLTQHCHKWDGNHLKHEAADPNSSIPNHKCSQNPGDLWSLYQPVRPVYAASQGTDPYKECRNANCGGYLQPLTLTYGATFSPSAAPAYLSWMAYLTDDLHEWLSQMRDDFNSISCENCNPGCTNGASCHINSGTSQCKCPSVVSCAGVLPLLYRYGFIFTDASLLNGWKYDTSSNAWKNNQPTVRSCQKFSQQLASVLSPDAPLAKLLESIDEFLHFFRYYFLYNQSTFWTIYIGLILYTFFFLLDTLHLRSHLKLTASHVVPPLVLLTQGTPLPITKLTYITQ
ncbi:extracellular matrix-binding protein ebh [Babesia caballi]|uniref:Extracellular matrix-binding protein ebh n=1 Tax=Babesia caballi TaxID=5871 RepID=A0AAV4LP82_BABCB|nr:extracellular matrix-binding protein ebh [Babesia caballi]